MFTTVAGTASGRALVGAFLKFFPGLNVAGMVISAAIAATVTTTFGEAYIATLSSILKDSPDRQPSADEIAEAFKSKLHTRK